MMITNFAVALGYMTDYAIQTLTFAIKIDLQKF
jgi:hypothetical protein